jgi:hypothetical protein
LNLFLIGVRGDLAAADRALGGLLERLPFLPGRRVETWSAPSGALVAAWAAHAPEQTGGVPYAVAERDRLALFSGRPIRWTGEREADGRGPIDPSFFLESPDGSALDGRFVAVRCDDARGELDVLTDPVGAYPIYETQVDGVHWLSNNAELLREVRGTRELDPAALAAVLGGGWSLRGDPVWAGVRRGGAGFAADRLAALFGAGFDPERAAALLTAATRALADWPDRPNLVPITGGRDSRLVLAAARRAGIAYSATTGGDESSPDVRIGRRLAEAAGVEHSLIHDDPHGTLWTDWRRAARVLALTESGTSTLADAAGFPLGPREGPLPLWHSGQGGEIARSYYGSGGELDRDALTERLARLFLGRRPGRADLLSDEGRELVQREIGSWVGEQLEAGLTPVDVPDAFYVQRRMGTWAGVTHGAVEYVRDTTSPLWSARLLPDLVGLPAAERARHAFHDRVLERLAPELASVSFEGGAHTGRLRRRTRQVARVVRRRLGPRPAGDPFRSILPEVREAVLEQPDHPAWPLLDRGRVESLLGGEPAALDTMSRYYVWRLATVFAGLELGG